jgi:glutamine amidotransferase
MCRHLAHLGPPVPLHDALFGAPHALVRQAEHPRHQAPGTTNADGWGVAWYPAPGGPPERHRTVTPMWDDDAFVARATSIQASVFVAAARLASPGATIAESGNAPFVDGRWVFSLNGIVDDFPGDVGAELRGDLEPARRDALVGDADTEVLFALVLQHLGRGCPADEALAAVVQRVLAITTGRLNLLLTDGLAVHATRVGNSLFRRGPLVASEPLDDEPAWLEVPDRTLTVLTERGAVEHTL